MPSAGQAVLRYFESVQSTTPEAFLQQLRPGLPSAAYRRMVIDTLPQQGNLVPTWREIAKLSSIRPIVAYHGLGQDFELRVVMLRGEAFIGLHARSVLLITRETLDLVDELQLQALVAHELGHDYVWEQYEAARKLRDDRAIQQLELLCDGIAVIALLRLSVDPEHLISAVTAVTQHNERLGARGRVSRYVPLPERVRFIRAIAKLTAARWPAHLP